MDKRNADPIDIHAGMQLRRARQRQGRAQHQIGAALGVTFQQIQKYEKGSNRMAASTLQKAAIYLDVPVGYFFASLPDGAGNKPQGDDESSSEPRL